MKQEIFNYSPSVEVLKLLTPGSLKQNLAKAVRLWVILRSIYGSDTDEVKLNLGNNFTFLEWRNLFFLETKKHHARDCIPILHNPNCRCATKLSEWLFGSNLSIKKTKWCKSFQKYYSVQSDELENLLLNGIINSSHPRSNQSADTDSQKSHNFSRFLPDGRLFAVTGRNLKDHDFQSLVNLGWLQRKKIDDSDTYFKIDKFPELFLTNLENIKTLSEKFTNEELSAFNNSLSQPINGIQRFFIHTEYIIHPKLYDRVESLQKCLKNIWEQNQVPLVKLKYQSAKLYQKTVNCIVYPVCIYYYKRAPYLFAYGQIPQQESKNSWDKIDWYDYRLDRIIKLSKIPKNVIHTKIPQDFIGKCYGNNPPSPDEIKNKMSDAWGFDIYKQQELLILRFEKYFYGNYIKGTERDEMFKKISHQQVEKNIKSCQKLTLIEQKNLISTVNSRSPEDIYCKVFYRINDNNIVMRLRAWGAKVEVILPWDLRQRMKAEMEANYKLYI
ncbi:TIGR03985 family CRISPR-associated protein [Mastigocoleus testarum]|uniref:CRISPR-associated protein n=1 Tax=Mastigocoleus testarum BC008 TaxID=371196 RepID=A0A0V7ZHC5_9CYAN|nr:TIGR03985 family CRISPR-associated protein [Mastigocoleus testarum]KST63831.1 CRISPR-associated protein [Mastigocoleus testarum BC008]